MPLPYRILHRFTIPLRYITPQNYALAPRYDSILCHCLTIPDLTELHHAIAIRHIAIAERNTTRQCRRKTQHYRTKLCLCKTLLDNAIAALRSTTHYHCRALLFSSSHSLSRAPLNRLNHAIPLPHATSPLGTAPRPRITTQHVTIPLLYSSLLHITVAPRGLAIPCRCLT